MHEVRVDQRREQVVRRRDRVQVAGEVEVQVLHRDHLRVAAAGSPALDTEDRPERGLAQAEHGLLAEDTEPLGQRHGGRRLPLPRRCRRDRRDVDQLRVRAIRKPFQHREIDLRLVAAVRLDLFGDEPEVGGDVEDRAHRRCLGDLEAGWHLGLHRSPWSAFSRNVRDNRLQQSVASSVPSSTSAESRSRDVFATVCCKVSSHAQWLTAAAASSDTSVSVWNRSSAKGAIRSGVFPEATSSASVTPRWEPP